MSEGKKPSWKDRGDYPDDGASVDRWAYEFLLRNGGFSKDFELAKAEQKELAASKALPLLWSEQPLGRVLVKYGVKTPVLPSWLAQMDIGVPVVFERHPVEAALYKIEGAEYRVRPESSSRIVLEFDLEAAIYPQIERAKKILTGTAELRGIKPKRNGGRNVGKKYARYLRVLDAIEAGVSVAKIAEVFSAEDSSGVTETDVRTWRKRGESLRDGEYLLLAGLS